MCLSPHTFPRNCPHIALPQHSFCLLEVPPSILPFPTGWFLNGLAYGITQGSRAMVFPSLNPGGVHVLLTKCIHIYTLFCMNTIIAAQTIHYNFLCQFNTKIVEARTWGQVFLVSAHTYLFSGISAH